MKLGVVGLPNVGKSTLFNAITQAGAEIANYPFCTIEPNVGVVAVPDERLDKLAALYDSRKITPTYLKFVDIAGLVKGASRGEGLGNKFLSHIREVDAIVHVVRCFVDSNITHVSDSIDPVSDMETINLELILADIETVNTRLNKALNMQKTGEKKYKIEAELLQRMLAQLESEKPIRSMDFDEEEQQMVEEMFLLTSKPVIYAANISENDLGQEDNPLVKLVQAKAAEEGAETLVICAKVEEELSMLTDEEKAMFLESYGITESGLNRLVKKCYKLLHLVSYLTAGEKETRAWTITEGTRAPQAAGKIHSDFEKGFIRAEIVPYQTMLELGGYNQAKEHGKVRSEGKDYIIKDGDVVLFRFNV
ncbi:MAG: redox-regulated ATPase YchF [Clostridia bacterium]|nr:redox-regulated ATPase YchF [Clostridia bacterium]MBQ8772694.1 redox-regulated ATPase YchF [Clostridia bacterium]MBQ8873132.1 redox-regulated ATPase YchF [Clostridia bacterium]MBQ9706935.1 redox-regulated ATPase YchF [Clostridia bacterium]MBR7177711.1 redox-regulated ATPase YchF [Clostridia bacterium]